MVNGKLLRARDEVIINQASNVWQIVFNGEVVAVFPMSTKNIGQDDIMRIVAHSAKVVIAETGASSFATLHVNNAELGERFRKNATTPSMKEKFNGRH